MLSDPMLVSGAGLGVPIATRKTYYSAWPLHPEIRNYPRRSFLQPATFVWKGEELVFAWRQGETVMNLLGARGRPDGRAVLDIVERSLAE